MSYLILARKYRPQKFSDLTGQETTAKILQSALASGRVAQAYLFSGSRGIGKTTSARIAAKALNCHTLNKKLSEGEIPELSKIEPCDACDSCREIAESRSLDVLELDAASHTQVDKIREAIIDTVNFAPARDRYKIFIIDEAHMLSTHSFNALLKTLEEPPPHAVFILATTEYHKIPITIISRCQRFRFLPLRQDEIADHLAKVAAAENIAVEADALRLLARLAGGAMRDALSLMDQAISHAADDNGRIAVITKEAIVSSIGVVREEQVLQFLESVHRQDAKAALSEIQTVASSGEDLTQFLRELRETLRLMLAFECGTLEEEIKNSVSFPQDHSWSVENILRAIQILNRAAEQMRWSDMPELVLEAASVRLCQSTLSADEILKMIDNGGGTKITKPEPPSLGFGTDSGSLRAAPPQTENKFSASSKTVSTPTITAPEKIESAGSESSLSQAPATDIGSAWAQFLKRAQVEKPFLYQNLVAANSAIEDGKVTIQFSRPFALEAVKRSQSWMDSSLSEIAGWRTSVRLNLAARAASEEENSASAKVSASADIDEDDGAMDIEDAAPTEPVVAIDDFADPDDTQQVQKVLGDPGVESFMKHFNGKIRRLPPRSV